MSTIRHDISTILKTAPDPLGVRNTTAPIVKDSQWVSLNRGKLKNFAQLLKKRIQKGQLLAETQFGHAPLSSQLIFILDSINFCFWAKKGQEKWKVEYPKGKASDGWEALVACFDRAVSEGIPLLDAKFLESITIQDVKHILRSRNRIAIPLINERAKNLRETGIILTKHFGGKFENLIKAANYDAPRIAKNILSHFPTFNDSSFWNGRRVNFHKRAQICAYDLSLLPNLNIKNTDNLTAFADYKLPQILRSFGVLQYKQSLAAKIDRQMEIRRGSLEELEIRASTIWACEMLAKILKIAPAMVDNALWFLTHESKRRMLPYHRTRTTYY